VQRLGDRDFNGNRLILAEIPAEFAQPKESPQFSRRFTATRNARLREAAMLVASVKFASRRSRTLRTAVHPASFSPGHDWIFTSTASARLRAAPLTRPVFAE
jgi:hypothetical protein